MKELIGVCGLNCETCEARNATINNDDELRKKVAKEWSELNKVLITQDMINCVGCRLDGVKTPFCDKLCLIKQCALKKEYATCADCKDLDNCEIVGAIIKNNKEAYKNLKCLNK